MERKITIKIKGHNVTCKHNNLTDAELVNLIGKHCAYLQKSPARRKVYRRTKLALGFKAFGKRLGYVLKAIRTACSPGFNEPDRRQDTSRGLFKLPERAR
jgi:predicted metal-dependent hydrolase